MTFFFGVCSNVFSIVLSKDTSTYLKSEVEIGKVRILSRLEHIFLEVNVVDFLKLNDLVLVDLFKSVQLASQVDQLDDSVRASA